jgi:FxsC-like protein
VYGDDDPGGWDENAERPYFFLSYAHVPRSRTGGAGDPNQWVNRLFNDLCDEVLHLTDLRGGSPVGFMDQSMHQGQLWAERLSQELASCRVFVPLYSPRYFTSVACGQEWHSFVQRPVFPERQSTERPTGIVPVLWIPMSDHQLPEVARQLQFNHRGFGPDYEAEGLYALMRLGYFRRAYELAVHRLAERIVDVAASTVIPPGRPLDFQAQPSAFPTPRTRQLRISVLSYPQAELPEGRNPDYYGPQPTDWRPYQPASSRPLVDHAARVARQLGFEPSVHAYEDEAESILADGPPAAPGLLLLDRWALRDETRREAVVDFDRRNPSWVSVLEPWNSTDPDCVADGGTLTELSARTLRSQHRDSRPSFHGTATELGSLEEFEAALPRAVMRAKYAFEESSRPPAGPGNQPEGGGSSGSARPSLRRAFESPPGTGDEPPRRRPWLRDDRHSDQPRYDEEDDSPPGIAFGGGEL